jgi:hypothetical protein
MELNFLLKSFNQLRNVNFPNQVKEESKFMINTMMQDILQFVPYTLLVGAVFLIILGGVALTVKHFRQADKRAVKR